MFLARTLQLRSVGLPGRMVGRQRNRWGRFGFVWLGVAVLPMRALGLPVMEKLRLMPAAVGRVGRFGLLGPTPRVARVWISLLRARCLLEIERPFGELPSSGLWS